MTILAQYNTPAFVEDFKDSPDKQREMNALWSANVARWVGAAQIGDIFDLVNYGPRPAFYNPLVTDTPAGATTAPITWNAFPGRFSALFPNNSADWNQWSDYGVIPQVTTDLCSGSQIAPIPYPPTGPRGWQDEYCEWSVTRDPATNKIAGVMFTCENPEYWLTLWQCDPNKVLELYRQLVNPGIQLVDLALCDVHGQPVTDPATGSWAYNPLNRWNSGPHSLAASGGAVHLTSSPNTLGAEFDLAAAASMPRINAQGQPVTTASDLVCCARYGKIGRNSDPTIGQNVNALVNSLGLQGALVTLTNPPGLYMQTPDWNRFKTPDGSDPSAYWTVVRGQVKSGGDLIDRILHATYVVPADKPFTVSDIQVDGAPLKYAGQITATIKMALLGTVFASGGANQTGVPCTISSDNPIPSASALQDLGVFNAYRLAEAQANELPLSIPVLALPIAAGTSVNNIALATNLAEPPASASVGATGTGVSFTVTGMKMISGIAVLIVSIAVAADAVPGDYGVFVTVPGSPTSPQPAVGLLTVAPAGGARFVGAASRRRPPHLTGRA